MGTDNPWILLAVSVLVPMADTDTESADLSAQNQKRINQNGQELTEIYSKQ